MSEDSKLDEALAHARPEDPAGLALARARVAGALFGTTATLGRFHILERLGHGGMGVVYAAYDPELDRKVALKMVGVPAGRRDVALAEAKALARVSHPNIVPVFDVGLVEDHVYIVMELVRGPTLRDWIAGKRPRAIIDVYRQAGAGLAAAHECGLVHRDFKPENAIVGGDGRVRVVDFGLACEAGESGRTGGTPKYMAPEQAGGAITPAVDQYSFCAALAEALGDAMPGWVEAIVERGRADAPDARWPAMTELLRALARDPARTWRRRAIAGGLAAVAVGAFFAGRARSADEPELCNGAPRIAASWPVRDAELARIASLSTYGRELAPRLAGDVSAYQARWAAGYRDACLTRQRELQSEALLDRRMICLDRGRDALATVAGIARSADAKALPDLARAIAALPEPEACGDLAALASDAAPPPRSLAPKLAPLRADLERARVQLAAGRSTVAATLAHGAADALRSLGYQPLLAEALLVEGHALMPTDRAAATARLRDATATGFAASADAIAIEAWARRAWLDGTNDTPEALGGLDVVDSLAKRTRSARFARALLLNSVGSVELARGHRDEARAAFARALDAARDVSGPGAIELLAIRRNMALATDDPAQRDKLLADVRGELARLLGPSHPDTLYSEYARATTAVVRLADTAASLATTCERFALHESLATVIPPCLVELGDLRYELGDRDGALAAFDRASERGGDKHDDVPELAGYRMLWRGDAAAAARAFDAALAARPVDDATPFYKRYAHAKLRLGQARALRALGRLDDARRALSQALAALHEVDDHSTIVLQRRLYAVRGELAEVLAAMHGKPADIAAQAAPAIAWYRRADVPARVAALTATGSP